LNGRVSKTGDIELPYETQDVAAGCEKKKHCVTWVYDSITVDTTVLWDMTLVWSEWNIRQLCKDVM